MIVRDDYYIHPAGISLKIGDEFRMINVLYVKDITFASLKNTI